MSIYTGQSFQRDKLKQVCQQIFNCIIQNESYHRQQSIKQNNQSQIILGQIKTIDLDQLSQDFLLFSSNPLKYQHWIKQLLNNIYNQQHLISSKQLMDFLLVEEDSIDQEIQMLQQQSTYSNIKIIEYKFYLRTPKYAPLIISFEQIIRDIHMFIVRNFHGQIIFISIYNSQRKKYHLIQKLTKQFQQPLLMICDNINQLSSQNSQITLQQFETLQQKTKLIYLKKTIHKQKGRANQTRQSYQMKFNTLFTQEYYKLSDVLCQIKLNKNEILKQILKRHHQFARQEIMMFLQANYCEKGIIRAILKINFQRNFFNKFALNTKQIKFKDFILDQIISYKKMSSQQASALAMHQPEKLIDQNLTQQDRSCLLCSQNLNLKKLTNYRCIACSKLKNKNIMLCPECFQPYHDSQKINYSGIYNTLCLQKLDQSQQQDLKMTQQKNKCQKGTQKKFQPDEVINLENQQERQIQSLEQVKFSESEQQAIMQFQQSGLKLIELFNQLKRTQQCYTPLTQSSSNEKQYSLEINNQQQYLITVEEIMRAELQAFQMQVVIRIAQQKQQRNQAKVSNCLQNKNEMDLQDHQDNQESQNIEDQQQMQDEQEMQDQQDDNEQDSQQMSQQSQNQQIQE